MMDLLSSSASDAAYPVSQSVSNLRQYPVRRGFGVTEANELLAQKSAPWLQSLRLSAVACSPAGVVLCLPHNARLLRPGGTVCGPALLACADTAMALAIMGSFGAFRNVATVNLGIDFMRAVGAVDIQIAATVRNQGRSLIFTECNFVPANSPAIAVHATATWAVIPSRRHAREQ
jgi:acyl-coenzyme A thioesterase PaaI-like protein